MYWVKDQFLKVRQDSGLTDIIHGNIQATPCATAVVESRGSA